MDQAKIKEVLDAHKEWRLSGGERGTRANLADAYLAGAYLADANLARANLADAYLVGANLVGAGHVIDAGTPNGWRCVGWMHEGALRVRVGCHDKAIAEGRAYLADKPDRREVLAALDYVETVAKLRAETDGYWKARGHQ